MILYFTYVKYPTVILQRMVYTTRIVNPEFVLKNWVLSREGINGYGEEFYLEIPYTTINHFR